MKIVLCVTFVLLVLAFAGDSYGHFTGNGHVHTHSETKQVFLNPDCQSTDTCDLKRFALTTSVDEIWFSDDPYHPTYRNGVIMEYETDSLGALEKYTIVQFIKGCVFYSSKNGQGDMTIVSANVPSFGEEVPLCFPGWVIDSQDTDPAYNSDPEYGRYYLLRWNKPGSYDRRTQKYYGAEKPKVPLVYMTDYPAGAFVTGTGVRNTALQFNTCIYKAGDVPAKTHRHDVNFASALTCFEWQNVYVYDFAKRQFQTHWASFPSQDRMHAFLTAYLAVIFITVLTALALVTFSTLKQVSQPKRSLMLGFGSGILACVVSSPLVLQDATTYLAIFVVAINALAGALIGVLGCSEAVAKGMQHELIEKPQDGSEGFRTV